VYGEEKKILCTVGRIEQPRQDKNLLYRHEEPNEPNEEGPLLFVLFESPFAPVSTVSRDHPSLVSLVEKLFLLFTFLFFYTWFGWGFTVRKRERAKKSHYLITWFSIREMFLYEFYMVRRGQRRGNRVLTKGGGGGVEWTESRKIL
jgi:hypothetical protein